MYSHSCKSLHVNASCEAVRLTCSPHWPRPAATWPSSQPLILTCNALLAVRPKPFHGDYVRLVLVKNNAVYDKLWLLLLTSTARDGRVGDTYMNMYINEQVSNAPVASSPMDYSMAAMAGPRNPVACVWFLDKRGKWTFLRTLTGKDATTLR